jgi:transposase
MAPNLAASQHELIQGMVDCGSLTDTQIADTVGCSTRSIRTIRANLRCFGTTRAPSNATGRPRSITPPMLSALCDRLEEDSDMYQNEMVAFLAEEFNVQVTKMSVSRALSSVG